MAGGKSSLDGRNTACAQHAPSRHGFKQGGFLDRIKLFKCEGAKLKTDDRVVI